MQRIILLLSKSAFLMALLVVTIGANANTTTTWSSAGSADFNLASNWTNGVPSATNDAIITDATATATLTANITVGNITLNGGVLSTSSFLLTGSGGTLSVGSFLYIGGNFPTGFGTYFYRWQCCFS